MAINYPGPYEFRVFLDSTSFSIPHEFRVSVNLNTDPTPGDAFSAIDCLNWDTTTQTADVTAEALLLLLAPFFHTSVNFTHVELWKYTTGTFESAFISAYSPVATTGGSSSLGTVPAQQIIMTFRTVGGGIAKLTIMEPTVSGSTRLSYPTGTASYDNLMAYFAGVDQPFNARDNTRPFAPLRFMPGQNEKLWRIINRS